MLKILHAKLTETSKASSNIARPVFILNAVTKTAGTVHSCQENSYTLLLKNEQHVTKALVIVPNVGLQVRSGMEVCAVTVCHYIYHVLVFVQVVLDNSSNSVPVGSHTNMCSL